MTIDAKSQQIHHIIDEHGAGADPFVTAIDEIARVLTPGDGEQIVLVAHNARFDVARLRLEHERAGRQLPDLPVLDTMALARHLGLHGGDLAALLHELGLANTAPHTATGDATATARAAFALLDRAALAGITDIDTLRAAAMGRRAARTSAIKAAPHRRGRGTTSSDTTEGAAPIDLPEDHLAGHAALQPDVATPAELTAWLNELRDCVRLRCPYLDDRVATASLPPDELLPLLEPLLADTLNADRPAGAATLLGALDPLLAATTTRTDALRWHTSWGARLEAAGRCLPEDRCPHCRADQPCPLDTWHQPLAAAALGPLDPPHQTAKNVLGKPQVDVDGCQGRRPGPGARRRVISPIIAHLIIASECSGRRS